jgi:hypothetical protein
MELDHIFICVTPGASEAEALKQFGLTEGTANQHLGQGTANRRFFFHNAFIELLYLHDATEIQNKLTKPTKLFERLTIKTHNTSPFGFCFRPSSDGETHVPFPHWDYRPRYLPKDLSIAIAYASIHEPMWFFAAFAEFPSIVKEKKQQPLEHPKGFTKITSVCVTIPDANDYSEAALCANSLHDFMIVKGSSHLLALAFNNKTEGKFHDFRPILPLIFKW